MDEERKKELKERLENNIKDVVKYLEELREVEIPEYEEYKDNFKIKAICERYVEKITESLISIALLIIRLKEFNPPEDEDHIFIILSKNNIISSELAGRLKDAKDMRNIIVHNYPKVDDLIIYSAITEEIIKDTEEFLNAIEEKIK